MFKRFTAIIHKEEDVYVSLRPELDIACQGMNTKEAKDNLKEAVELFFECASPRAINKRVYDEHCISKIVALRNRLKSFCRRLDRSMLAPILIDHSKNRGKTSALVPFRDTFQTVS